MAEAVSLFVYGSFTEGMIHNAKIAQYVTDKRPASIQGHAYRLEVGYPVYVAERSVAEPPAEPSGAATATQVVQGELLRIEAPAVVFQILDEFHGVAPLTPEKSLFHKIETTATVADGATVPAWTYSMNPAKLPKNAMLITDGDWREDLRQRPPLLQFLTEKHRCYIKKLGKTTGREVIPYDLNLCRELMKLDLVVDKGRRLALTRLGKEVLRYLPE